MWLLGNSWKFLHQILCSCLAVICPFMCCFCLKLLDMYEIGMTSNFKFVMWFCVPNNYCQIYGGKLELKLRKSKKYSIVLICIKGIKIQPVVVKSDCLASHRGTKWTMMTPDMIWYRTAKSRKKFSKIIIFCFFSIVRNTVYYCCRYWCRICTFDWVIWKLETNIGE